MRIALDYDGTYTRCPELFENFIKDAQRLGIEVVCVTMRHPHEPVNVSCPVFYTGRVAKLFWCARNGLTIDVWVDDHPEFIIGDAL